MKIKLIPHDRSHYAPPGGHIECGKESCLNSENLVKAHALKYNRTRDPDKSYFYNGSSESDLISEKKLYLCRIEGGWIVNDGWYLGNFSRVWFGWSFDGWYAPMQLSGIWLVYEVSNMPTDDLCDPNASPSTNDDESEDD